MAPRPDCKCGGEKRSNGNCSVPGADGAAVQCVGQWAADKHWYLKQYIDATHAVRAQYLPPKGSGGAAFIDLFAGPGIVRVRETAELREGSPMLAMAHTAAPFTRIVLCDLDHDNVAALRARTASSAARVSIVEGDCNAKIDDVLRDVPTYGLNISLIDPFALQALKFETIRRLAAVPRMDLVIHFPTADIKRNLGQHEATARWLDEALGTTEWRSKVGSSTDVAVLIDLFKTQLATLGYKSQGVRSEPIRNSQNLPLYYLVYASKSDRGDKIWQSITKNAPSGQRGFGFR